MIAVDPVAGDDTASGGPWKSWSHAAQVARPGDVVQLAAGDYGDQVEIAVDGTAAQPIVFQAMGRVHMTSTVTFHDHAFVQIRGVTFDSPDAQAWILMDGANHDIAFVGNAFDSHAPNQDDGAFTGIGITGSQIALCGNAFGSWLGDEVSADAVDGLLVENNDWSQASGEHSLLAIVGHHIVIRGNAFRNPWQRAIHITDRDDDDRTDDVLIEHNSFIDSDWITGSPNPSNDDQFRGGNEVVRFLGARGIFRNNLLAGNHEGDNWACHGILNFQTFISGAGIDTRRFAQFRVYNNTFDSNATSAIIFYAGPEGIDLSDNQFKNNVIASSAVHAFSICNGDIPWMTYRFANNVVPGAGIHINGEDVTTEAAETAAPSVFAANTDAVPTYVDGAFGSRVAADFTSYSIANLDDAFAAYRLAPTSSGVGSADPLAHVATATTGTVITVDDALYFCDGFGVTTGDRVVIGGVTATITARDLDAGTITLDTPVTVAVGDPIDLAGATTDPGVY